MINLYDKPLYVYFILIEIFIWKKLTQFQIKVVSVEVVFSEIVICYFND